MSNSSRADQSMSLDAACRKELVSLQCNSLQHMHRSHLCGYSSRGLKTAKCFALPAPRSASDPGLGGRVK